MDTIPEEAGENSKVNETSPLLHDDAFTISAETLAIGGAAGGGAEGGGAAGGAPEEPYISRAEINNVVERLFAAWQKFYPKTEGEVELANSDFLEPPALSAMTEVWRQIIREKRILPTHMHIVIGLAHSISYYVFNLHRNSPNLRSACQEFVLGLVIEAWHKILDDTEELEAKEKAAKRRERKRKFLKEKEKCETRLFYQLFEPPKRHEPNCQSCCTILCNCCSMYIIQVILHSMLLPWPLSLGIMGGIYMNLCPMSSLIPYMMIAMGVSGTIALLTRLSFVFYEKFTGDEINVEWPWFILRAIEFFFMVFLIVQLYLFFTRIPNFDKESTQYCSKTFHTFVHWINYVSITVVAIWLFAYTIKGILLWQYRKYNISPLR